MSDKRLTFPSTDEEKLDTLVRMRDLWARETERFKDLRRIIDQVPPKASHAFLGLNLTEQSRIANCPEIRILCLLCRWAMEFEIHVSRNIYDK